VIAQGWTDAEQLPRMSDKIPFSYIDTGGKLRDFCLKIRGSAIIGFDTEFVSEDRFSPELCLLQICAGKHLAIVDTLAIEDLSPFWELVSDEAAGHTTIVHAAREEFRFCVNACGKRPANLFDTQVAAGLTGMDYPASYSNLVARFAGQLVSKNETRTNWRHRPLSDNQLQYAIKDVLYLQPVYVAIRKLLDEYRREEWLEEEMATAQEELQNDMTAERWDRLPGVAGMQPQQLAVIRALWLWREETASRLNTPARRVLRDDLVVELAKRGIGDRSEIRAVRGMEYGRVQKYLNEISAVIAEAANAPRSECPNRSRKSRIPNLGLLGQFLSTALGVICRDAGVAPNLVATTDELRTVAAWRLGLAKLPETPRLFSGWRKELIGRHLDEILKGEKSIRVVDPKSEQPLAITD
jgi:ribonuclease D